MNTTHKQSSYTAKACLTDLILARAKHRNSCLVTAGSSGYTSILGETTRQSNRPSLAAAVRLIFARALTTGRRDTLDLY
jgi:hypothetical protein